MRLSQNVLTCPTARCFNLLDTEPYYKLGRKLTFDPKTETFPGDAEANKLLTRVYREPYGLPDKV